MSGGALGQWTRLGRYIRHATYYLYRNEWEAYVLRSQEENIPEPQDVTFDGVRPGPCDSRKARDGA